MLDDPKRNALATRVVFFFAGLALACWAPLIPTLRQNLRLDDAQLGGLLLCLGLGSVTTMLFSGGLAARFGCRRVILTAGALASLALPLIVTAPSPAVFGVSLFLMGAGIGTVDVVMNIHAIIVERASGRSMMSGFHALFSVGGVAGAGAMTALLALKVAPLPALLAILVPAAGMVAASWRGLLPYGGETGTPVVALPRGRVLIIGAMCFVMFLAEASVADWSGILLHESRGLEKSLAGIGYVAFSLTMTLGRFAGDRVVEALGAVRTLVFGGLATATGFAVAALVPSWPVAVVGFLLVGAGAANVVPVLFSAAGRQKAMPANLAMAGVTTMGYAGILVGPALIGFFARATSLPTATLGVGLLTLAVVATARVTTRG